MPATEVKPIRVKPRVAAEMLGVGYEAVLDMVRRKVFTVFDNGKRGVKRRIHLLREEVVIYGEKGEAALKEHRARARRPR
jgi:hypothetical protein